jgi:hypothetical protein
VSLGLIVAACSSLASSGGSKTAAAARPTQTPNPSPASPRAAAPTTSASGGYVVTFGVSNRVGRLGAVQFDASAKGGADWQGTAASVACRNLSGASMMACNDKGGGRLSCAFVDANGIGTPLALVTCRISSSKPLAASDFTVKVVDASSPAMKPAKATVVVTSIAGS